MRVKSITKHLLFLPLIPSVILLILSIGTYSFDFFTGGLVNLGCIDTYTDNSLSNILSKLSFLMIELLTIFLAAILIVELFYSKCFLFTYQKYKQISRSIVIFTVISFITLLVRFKFNILAILLFMSGTTTAWGENEIASTPIRYLFLYLCFIFVAKPFIIEKSKVMSFQSNQRKRQIITSIVALISIYLGIQKIDRISSIYRFSELSFETFFIRDLSICYHYFTFGFTLILYGVFTKKRHIESSSRIE